MKRSVFCSILKPLVLVAFLTPFSVMVYSQSGVDHKGQEVTGAANMVDKSGAKGNGTGRTKYGGIFINAVPLLRCDGTQPTTVVDITSALTGKIWMDRNLGASRAATSVTDFYAYGCLYQWGRGNDGHASITWTSSTGGTPVNAASSTLTNTPGAGSGFITASALPFDWRVNRDNNLWNAGSASSPCPTGYRIPTYAEAVADIPDYNAGLTLKIPYAGYRNYSGGFVGQGDQTEGGGWIWTTTSIPDPTYGLMYNYGIIKAGLTVDYNYGFRNEGHSVRCIKQ